MKKGLTYLAILAALSMMPMSVFAGNISMGTIERTDIGDSYEDPYDAPKLYVELEDAYTRAGKKEEFEIKLEDATWVDGEATSITAEDLEEILPEECHISVKSEKTALVTIDIPSDVKEGDKIGFKIPLRVEVIGKSPLVKVIKTSETKLMSEAQFAIGIGEGKKAIWEVNDVTSYDQSEQIIMAPLTFSEAAVGFISEQELTVDLTLENPDFRFQVTDYKSVKEHAADMEYTLDGSKYLLYEGGFSGLSNDLVIKTYPNDPRKITLKLKGGIPSSIGKITLHNLPIMRVGDASKEEDVTLSIGGNEVIDGKSGVIVAYAIYREKPANTINQTNGNHVSTSSAGTNQDTSINQGQADIEGAERHAQFVIDQPSYKVNDVTYPMTAAPYLDGGYTMVPVRYVALAFGAEEKDIMTQGNQIQISVLGKNIILKKQSNIVLVDGKEVTMATPVKINSGRVYVPIGEISEILGIHKTWDKVTRTVDFTK